MTLHKINLLTAAALAFALIFLFSSCSSKTNRIELETIPAEETKQDTSFDATKFEDATESTAETKDNLTTEQITAEQITTGKSAVSKTEPHKEASPKPKSNKAKRTKQASDGSNRKPQTEKATSKSEKSSAAASSGSVPSKDHTEYKHRVLTLVNAERKKANLPPLAFASDLNNTAALRSKEIAQKFDHERPDGTSCMTAFPTGYYTMGENIAYGYHTPEEVVQAWMDSEGHRKNIMSERFTVIGIGCYEDSHGTIYWVQCFGG